MTNSGCQEFSTNQLITYILYRFKTVHCILYPFTSWCPWTLHRLQLRLQLPKTNGTRLMIWLDEVVFLGFVEMQRKLEDWIGWNRIWCRYQNWKSQKKCGLSFAHSHLVILYLLIRVIRWIHLYSEHEARRPRTSTHLSNRCMKKYFGCCCAKHWRQGRTCLYFLLKLCQVLLTNEENEN